MHVSTAINLIRFQCIMLKVSEKQKSKRINDQQKW